VQISDKLVIILQSTYNIHKLKNIFIAFHNAKQLLFSMKLVTKSFKAM